MQVRLNSKTTRLAVGLQVLCLAWSCSLLTAQTERGQKNSAENNPPPVADHKRQAILSFKNGDYEGALKHFRVVVQGEPNDVESQDNIGVTLARLGRAKEAVAALLKAVEIDGRFSPAHYHLGLIYDRMGRTREAVAQYQEALQLNPAFTQARYALSGVCWRIGDLEGAVELLQEVLRADPNSREVRLNLAVGLWRKGDLDAAIEHLKTVVELHPKEPRAYSALGQILVENRTPMGPSPLWKELWNWRRGTPKVTTTWDWH